MSKILFISNGYGEDAIAITIIRELKRLAGDVEILAFPLVGEGRAYQKEDVQVVAPVQNLPSGGLIPGGWLKNLWMDFKAGLATLIFQQISTLKKLKDIDLTVAVGDTYPVILGGLFTSAPVIFVGTAKSDYFVSYSKIEQNVFHRYCSKVYPRDEPTAESLRNSGIDAQWLGNAMMDGIDVTGDRFGIPEDHRIITLLPGSRDFAYADFPIILNAVDIIHKNYDKPLSYLTALAPSITLDRLEKSAKKAGFSMNRIDENAPVAAVLVKDSVEIKLLRGRFGDSIHLAHLVIGQAGTGNEQAVGLGKPVIGFDSDGRKKAGWYRARQKGLLGDALAVVERNPEAVNRKALELLNNQEEYNRMAQIGFERMGPAGGAGKMAAGIYEFLQSRMKQNKPQTITTS